jgi:LPXTG-site transpeptidase (sortase) family protein
MPLYSYRKDNTTYHSSAYRFNRRESKVVFEIEQKPLTLWKLIQGFINDFRELLTSSRIAGTLIPAVLIFYGLNLLSVQIIPAFTEHLQKQRGNFDQGSTLLVSDRHVSAKQSYLSNPGSDYFEKLQSDAYSTNTLMNDPISHDYRGTFLLSIPSLGLIDLPVRANVNSGDEAVYDKVLENGLAHMENTGLPISDIKNNIVVYGHSSAGNYYQRTKDVAAAFSILNKAKIGDEIIIKMEGKEYKYKVSKTKIVGPYDISIITGDSGLRQSLTLFTCFPAGNNANRLVVNAIPVE